VPGGASFVYDTFAHPATVSVTGAGGLNLSPAPVYSCGHAPVDVADSGCTASYNYPGDVNHTGSSDSKTYTITKAAATLTLNGTGTFVFDMQAHAATVTTTPPGLTGASITYNGSAAAPIAVGTYNVVASLNNPNYQAPNANGTITITPWTIQGFFQPVDMNGMLNGIKGGSTVPLKFRVYAGTTELKDTSVVLSFRQVTINCSDSAPTDDIPIEQLATGGTSLRYDLTGGQFIFNWQSVKAPNKCYQVILTTQDGSSITANFKTK
jgi:MBG domain-containing protein